jgi:hypothetical protein
MAAITQERLVRRYGMQGRLENYPVAATTKILQGALVVLNAAKTAENAATATGKTCVGICDKTVDNTTGAAGDKTVQIREGVHGFLNSSAGDLIAQADVGADCYIVDNQTVAKTDGTGTRSRAGKIIRLEDGLVYVETGIGR